MYTATKKADSFVHIKRSSEFNFEGFSFNNRNLAHRPNSLKLTLINKNLVRLLPCEAANKPVQAYCSQNDGICLDIEIAQILIQEPGFFQQLLAQIPPVSPVRILCGGTSLQKEEETLAPYLEYNPGDKHVTTGYIGKEWRGMKNFFALVLV